MCSHLRRRSSDAAEWQDLESEEFPGTGDSTSEDSTGLRDRKIGCVITTFSVAKSCTSSMELKVQKRPPKSLSWYITVNGPGI